MLLETRRGVKRSSFLIGLKNNTCDYMEQNEIGHISMSLLISYFGTSSCRKSMFNHLTQLQGYMLITGKWIISPVSLSAWKHNKLMLNATQITPLGFLSNIWLVCTCFHEKGKNNSNQSTKPKKSQFSKQCKNTKIQISICDWQTNMNKKEDYSE